MQNEIKFPNGCYYKGEVKDGKPTGTGTFLDQHGEVGVCFNGSVYIQNTGQFGPLNLKSGKIAYKPYFIFFKNPNEYSMQFGDNSKCIGVIRWPNGCIFEGQIHNETPYKGEFIGSTGELGSACISQKQLYKNYKHYVFPYASGNCGILNIETGYIRKSAQYFHFNRKCHYVDQQWGDTRFGSLQWTNGNKYFGEIHQSSQIPHGKLVSSSGKQGIYRGTSNQYLYIPRSNIFGLFLPTTGQPQIQQYKIHFTNKIDYLTQHQLENTCKGTMTWTNGCVFEGILFNNKMYEGILKDISKGIIEVKCIQFKFPKGYENTIQLLDKQWQIDHQKGKHFLNFDLIKGEYQYSEM